MAVNLTDRCNFDCVYCYQPKGPDRLDLSTLVTAIDHFYPDFAAGSVISFYGGEPLLEFDTLRRAVEHAEALSAECRGVRLRYALTTNGSLLDEDVLNFLDDHRFSLMLSFDGLAQDLQRKKGTFALLISVIPRILARSGISLETNSVFSPETVGYLSESVQSLVGLGVRKINVNFALEPSWTGPAFLLLEEQIARVGEHFQSRYGDLADIPWPGLGSEPVKGLRYCSAGRGQMALSAQGTLWGCALFPYYFAKRNAPEESAKYCFGEVDAFIRDPQRIHAEKTVHYSALRMARFSTAERPCLLCPEIEWCWVCPIAAALATGKIGRIPDDSCRGGKILRNEKRRLRDQFEKRRLGLTDKPSDQRAFAKLPSCS